MDNRIKVRCLECGRKWKTASEMPQCSRCNSVDVEPAEAYALTSSKPADAAPISTHEETCIECGAKANVRNGHTSWACRFCTRVQGCLTICSLAGDSCRSTAHRNSAQPYQPASRTVAVSQ